jgi:hypothetical protein
VAADREIIIGTVGKSPSRGSLSIDDLHLGGKRDRIQTRSATLIGLPVLLAAAEIRL